MCKYASPVLTKDNVFWSKKTESHAEIIKEFNLCESDSTHTRINLVNVEISPTTCWGTLSKWEYKVDQDIMPPWFDAKDCELRTRKALKEKIDRKLLANFKLLDAFLAEIKTVKWLKRHRKPLKAWKVFYGKDLATARDAAGAAAGAAAEAAARDAAGATAWAAAWATAGAAAEAAARDAAGATAWATARDAAGAAAEAAARDAAWAAAWATARDAAWAAARDAARATAWAAARDAELQSTKIICTGLKIDPKHIKHIDDRWEVWKRGYALLCDVNGVLYVYGVKK